MVGLKEIQHLVVMGVSGCGKSTVAELLANRIDAEFLEGDSLHSAENVAAMKRGQPLDDARRAPWLQAIAARIEAARFPGIVVSCSALKRDYRRRLAANVPVTFLHLSLPRAVALERVRSRTGHFMPDSLIDSQFGTLEELGADERGWRLDATEDPSAIVRKVEELLCGPKAG